MRVGLGNAMRGFIRNGQGVLKDKLKTTHRYSLAMFRLSLLGDEGYGSNIVVNAMVCCR
jgi:hypothetical protein